MINFPDSPTLNQSFTSAGATWTWDGTKWVAASGSAAYHDVGRNLIHNSMFNIAQRGVGPFTLSGSYVGDRWLTSFALDSNTFQVAACTDANRAAIGDEDARFFFADTFTGNAGAGSQSYVEQRIERVQRLSGKTVTLSFWAGGSAELKLGLNLFQLFGTGGSPSAFVQVLTTGSSFNLTTSFVRYTTTLTIPSTAGKVFGTNADDFTILRFYFSSGATSNQAAGNIGVQAGNISIWGVQLEIGSTATPLEKPDPQQDLAKCQRFYQLGAMVHSASNQTAGQPFQGSTLLPVTMRVAPTLVVSANANVNMSSFVLSTYGAAIYNGGSSTANGSSSLTFQFTASADL